MAEPRQPGWDSLISELAAGREMFAVIDCSTALSVSTIENLGRAGSAVVSIGAQVTRNGRPADPDDVMSTLSGPTLLTDIEVLFTPGLGVDVVSLLRRTARRLALVVAWPGRIENGRLTYSAPGRQDHLDAPIRDLLVLRPKHTDFPDEVPYVVERFPA